jgi:hypothetical protein
MPEYVNLDAAETMFFERELESVKSRTYDAIRAPLKALELIPMSTDAGAGAETITYQQFDMTGIAKIVANYDDDLPRANVKGKEFTSRVKSIGNSFGYSLQEVRAAQLAGSPLNARLATAAGRAQREKWNRLAFYGDEEHGIQGWLNNVNVPSSAVVAGESTNTEWSTKTADEILKDMNDAVTQVINTTNGAEQPDTIVLPINQYRLINTTARSANSDLTILQYFERNNPGVSVEWANELAGSFDGENGFIVYRRDPETMTLEMPSPFEMLPVQEGGFEYVVPCHSRFGGVIVYYPLSMAFKTGI